MSVTSFLCTELVFLFLFYLDMGLYVSNIQFLSSAIKLIIKLFQYTYIHILEGHGPCSARAQQQVYISPWVEEVYYLAEESNSAYWRPSRLTTKQFVCLFLPVMTMSQRSLDRITTKFKTLGLSIVGKERCHVKQVLKQEAYLNWINLSSLSNESSYLLTFLQVSSLNYSLSEFPMH